MFISSMYPQALIQSLQHECHLLCPVVQLNDGTAICRQCVDWLRNAHHPFEYIRVPRELSSMNAEADAFGDKDDVAVLETEIFMAPHPADSELVHGRHGGHRLRGVRLVKSMPKV